jgi:hypothetical protein
MKRLAQTIETTRDLVSGEERFRAQNNEIICLGRWIEKASDF